MPLLTRVPIRIALTFLVLASLARFGTAMPAAAAGAPANPQHTEPVPGVHVFQTAPYGDVGLDGNSVAIVTSEGVVVFDAERHAGRRHAR
jgi:hypothetical protein